MRTPSKKQRGRRYRGARLAGLGMELLGAILGFTVLGLWIDRSYDTSPWGVLICVICGFVGGFYNLIRSSLEAFRNTRTRPDKQHRDHDTGS